MSSRHIVVPIALDLGASKTGIYSCCYPANINLNQLSAVGQKTAFVANIKNFKDGGYTLLQTNRTAKRHAIRCRTRNKQAKKLLSLILDVNYGFPVHKHREAINHLMNRRGFSYIESQISPEAIDATPQEVIEKLAQELVVKGQEPVAEMFTSTAALSDTINYLMCNYPSTLQPTLDIISKWAGKDSKRKSAIKALAESLDFYIKDLTAGAQFRAKYFNAINKDIKLMAKHPLKHCRKFLFALQDYGKRKDIDMIKAFSHLLCHLNNFDLKLLNHILRKITPKADAQTIEHIVAEYFGKWICKQWSVDIKANGQTRIADIKKLQQSWQKFTHNKPGKIIEFFIQTSPEQTIPPYESHTNRHPPRCQTLLLNPCELNRSYPDWQLWITQLTAQESIAQQHQYYCDQFSNLLSSKNKPLIEANELAARQLHLLLDTSKARDPYKFNEIWSQLKKRNELLRKQSCTNKIDAKLDSLLTNSKLPLEFYPNIQSLAPEKSFWHLVNRYYQARRRARSGRYFLHYDNQQSESNRWQSDDRLLAMCQHRPRQLKSQALGDICALLGLKVEQLSFTDTSQLQFFFKKVKGLKTACEQAYQAQKRYGADLKSLLYTDKDLIKRNEKVPVLIDKLAKLINLSETETERFTEHNQSFYVLAQLYPLVWGDRCGFGKTCPICARDNGVRMADIHNQAQASRLSTLSMRLIDGALKRLLTHQAHHIANRLWPQIADYAENADSVTIPLILEQNRFDFTENLPALKGVPPSNKKGSAINLHGSKQERIVAASKGVCPYKNSEITVDSGDLDHIIPRSGQYGVLNDEANLIYSSTFGNRKVKQDRILTLDDLNATYLEKQFKTKDVNTITQLIEQRLWQKDKQAFTFGQYRQFVALSEDNQIAFRHALFLSVEHPLRTMVINAITHNRKAKVNGTQRYMAQLLADIFITKAKKTGFKSKLKFDYFEISSNGLDEDSTVALRRLLRTSSLSKEFDLIAYDKQSGKSQQDYSHVIDATCAFMLALDKHQGEGSLKLALASEQSVWGEIDADGVISANVFEQVAVEPDQLAKSVLVSPRSNEINILQLNKGLKPHQVISRPVFKQNAIGLDFYDLCIMDGKLFKGFIQYEQGEALFIKDKDKPIDNNINMATFAKKQGYYQELQHGKFTVFHPNKSKLTTLLFNVLDQAKNRNNFNTEDELVKLALWLFGKAGQLFFYTSNASLDFAPSIVQKQSASPYFSQWKWHYDNWFKVAPDTKVDKGRWVISTAQLEKWESHCKEVLAIPQDLRAHRPVKNYSMKAITNASGTMALIRRTAASGNFLYQLYSFDNTTLSSDHIPIFALNSPNVVLLKKERITKGYPMTFKEKKIFKAQFITTELFFDPKKCDEYDLSLDKLEVFATKPTQVEIRNLSISWLNETLVQIGHSPSKPWTEQKTIALSNLQNDDDTLKQSILQSILSRGCKSDQRLEIKIEGEQLTLSLPYKSASLAKLLVE